MSRNIWRDLGEVSYNGFRFNNLTRTVDLNVAPVLDSSGRYATHNEWSLTLETEIAVSTGKTDALVRDAISRLSEPGKAFRFRGRGFGNPDINTGDAVDIRWGPTPGRIGVTLVGAGTAVRLRWPVTFRIPVCPNGADRFAMMELAYTVEYSPDDAGFTDRHIRGHLVIPISRQGDNKLSDSADEYRAAITPPRIRGFRRTFGPWLLSEDRTRLDFSFTDSEMGGEPLPPGVVEAEFSEDIGSTQAGLMHWSGTFAGSYRLHKRSTGLQAAAFFLKTCEARLKQIREQLGKTNQKSEIIPVSFRMTNPNRHGKPAASFSLGFTFVSSLKTLLQVAGIWEPLNLTTFDVWEASLADTALHPYGSAKLRFELSTDKAVGLCIPGDASMTGSRNAPGPTFPPPPAAPAQQTIAEMMKGTFPKPSPGNSWVKYEVEITVEVDSGVVPVRLLPKAVLTKSTDIFGVTGDIAGRIFDAMKLKELPTASAAPAAATPTAPASSSTSDGTLRRAEPLVVVYLTGNAVRAGYPVEPPRLLELNGVECIPADRLDRGEGYTKGVNRNAAEPLHYCRWRFRYVLPRVPAGTIEVPKNPMEGAT